MFAFVLNYYLEIFNGFYTFVGIFCISGGVVPSESQVPQRGAPDKEPYLMRYKARKNLPMPRCSFSLCHSKKSDGQSIRYFSAFVHPG